MNGESGFWAAFLNSLRTQSVSYILGGIFTILAVFPTYFADRIKSGLNKANAREDKYTALASLLSGYIFDCEQVEECLANGRTSKKDLVPIILDYNNDITALRKSDYSNRMLLSKYWNTQRRDEFVVLMKEVLAIDTTMHGLNDEFEAVNIAETKSKVDPARASNAALALHALLDTFRLHAEKLLNDMQ